jgi:L-ascorbate metabolism protein UlaG (beta-lactamase superfamily)
VALADLPPIHAVLLSHNHYDHLDVATLKALHRAHAPLIITPLGNDRIVRRHIADARLVALDWHQAHPLDPSGQAQAHCVPALHWSSRTPRDRRMALWGGFVIRAAGRTIYFAGDTGYGTGPSSARSAPASARSTARCCRSAPMTRAGSWPRSTPIRRCAAIQRDLDAHGHWASIGARSS